MTAAVSTLRESRLGRVAVLTLNRPEALNALSLEMILGIERALDSWRDDPEIAAVLIESSSEKAFCSGGDVRRLGEALLAGKKDAATRADALRLASEYFAAEFFVDHMLHVYPKPIVAWANRITMGGGLGLLAGASHRIVTPETVLAMPEIAIGYFPDVGATWFLNRMPEPLGLFLGITAARFSGPDAVQFGLATHCLPGDAKAAFREGLAKMEWTGDTTNDRARLTNLCRSFCRDARSELAERWPKLRTLQAAESFADFHAKFLALDATEDAWLATARAQYEAGSPLSRRVIFEQMRRGRELTKRAAFELEWQLAVHFSLRPDFAEGVRAVLIDKDKSPKWDPPTVEQVTDREVAAFFELPPGFATNPLAVRFRKA